MLPRLRYFNFTAILVAEALSSSAPVLAQDPERGIELNVSGSSFFGGDSGPTVPGAPVHPETRYGDTFGTGYGITAQYFRQVRPVLRWQLGIIHQNWPGEFFEGGEFQDGWEFGAGGQFDDLTFTGVYGGITLIRQSGAKLRPFASIDLAIVSVSKVEVVVSGASQPYWESSIKDFLLMKGGLAYEVSPSTSVIFQAGFSVLGKPENVSIFSAGTAGSSLVVGIGASYSF